jgi:hypothetical protein
MEGRSKALVTGERRQDSVAAGVNVAFLSGNTCCGRIRLRPGASGAPNRLLMRLDRFGPRDPLEVKDFPEMAEFPWNSPNENTLIGARSTFPVTGGADWICAAPEHWLFEGTGMKKGEGIPGLVGWEWHGDPAAIPGLQVVAAARPPARAARGPTPPPFTPAPREISSSTPRAAGGPMASRSRPDTCGPPSIPPPRAPTGACRGSPPTSSSACGGREEQR